MRLPVNPRRESVRDLSAAVDGGIGNQEWEMNDKSILFGRKEEVAELQALLRQNRYVAVVGSYGVGKTALVMHVADASAQEYPGGVHFISARQIGLGAQQTFKRLQADLVESAKRGRTLVVVDGVDEMVPEVSTDLLEELLSTGEKACFLMTSREPVRRAESTLRLGGLLTEHLEDLLAAYGIVGQETSELRDLLMGNPLSASLIGSAIESKAFRLDEIPSLLREFKASGIVDQQGHPLDATSKSASSIGVEVAEINDELLKRLEENIDLACELSPRKFEELVAELFARQGYAVELTPASKDGGKDIYVAKRDSIGSFMYLVECKRYALPKPVGVKVVRALHGTVQAERATAGVLVTTSTFTKGARDFQQTVEYQLSLRDYAELHRWICQARHGGNNFLRRGVHSEGKFLH